MLHHGFFVLLQWIEVTLSGQRKNLRALLFRHKF